jgi:hypothetical protein
MMGAGPAEYQPGFGSPAVPPPAVQGARRKGLLGVGGLVLLAGLGGGGAMYATSSSTYESAVKDMARAPIGCTTTLDFAKKGDYNLFVETSGSTTDVGGDCAGNGDSYQRDADDLPDVDLVLTDGDDNEVDLDRNDEVSYDAGGYVGSSVRTVSIEEPGTYKLLVTSDEDEFAISIGKDPQKDADEQKNLGIGLAALGVIIGGALLLLGLRRKKPAAAPPAGGPGWGQQMQTQQAPGWPPQPAVPQQPQPSWGPQQQPPAAPQPTWPQQQPPPQAPPPPPGWGSPQQ